MISISELFQLALQSQESGNLAQAESLYHEIVQADPTHAEAHHFLGILMNQGGRSEEAIVLIRRAIDLTPDNAAFHFSLGNIFMGQANVIAAVECFRQTLRLNPDHSQAYVALGFILQEQGHSLEAMECYRQALRINPKNASALHNLGMCHLNDWQIDDAVDCFRQALSLQPDNAKAYINLGNVLFQHGEADEAAECFRQALRINPKYSEALNNLGIVFLKQNRFAEAVECFQNVLAINPNQVDAHYNLGMLYAEQQNFARAAECFQQTLAIDSHHASALMNLAMLHLQHGDLEGGWQGYEQRWFQPGRRPRSLPQPRWDGAPLNGQTILLYAEQGLGDTIQFIRFAPMVKERGGRVLVECQPALVKLLAEVEGVDQVVAHGNALPEYDVQIPLMSLGGIFHTSLATIPAKNPYLQANPGLISSWRKEMEPLPGYKIGIAWQGNPNHTHDRIRSLPLMYFDALARVEGVRLVSLQMGPGSEQLMENPFPVTHLGSRFNPFSLEDLAAVLMNLDLVVTVDTVVAHLAGALGLPVWTVIPLNPDWRWLLGGDDSPWYPTLRLFRQNRLGDWSDVFQRMATEIRGRIV